MLSAAVFIEIVIGIFFFHFSKANQKEKKKLIKSLAFLFGDKFACLACVLFCLSVG